MGAGSHEVQGMLRLTFLTCCVLLLTGCGSDDSEPVGIHDVAYESPVDYDITLAGNDMVLPPCSYLPVGSIVNAQTAKEADK